MGVPLGASLPEVFGLKDGVGWPDGFAVGTAIGKPDIDGVSLGESLGAELG